MSNLPGVSLTYKQLFLSGSDFDIFLVGFRKDLIRLPTSLVKTGSGISNMLP